MIIHGTLVELGDLENGLSAVIEHEPSGLRCTVAGLSGEQVRALAPCFMDRVTIVIEAEKP